MTETTPAGELREAAARLRELAKAAKEATHPGHGEWQPWSTVQNTKWEAFPEPHVVTQEEADAVPFGLGSAGDIHEGHYVPTGEAFVAHARYAHDTEEDWYEPEFFAGPLPEGLARFVASMHPGVARAVADWLDDRATSAAKNLVLETPECPHEDGPCGCNPEPAWACNHCLGWVDVASFIGGDDCTCYTGALKVARVYLGTKEDSDAS